jgi:hypothetical protein
MIRPKKRIDRLITALKFKAVPARIVSLVEMILTLGVKRKRKIRKISGLIKKRGRRAKKITRIKLILIDAKESAIRAAKITRLAPAAAKKRVRLFFELMLCESCILVFYQISKDIISFARSYQL